MEAIIVLSPKYDLGIPDSIRHQALEEARRIFGAEIENSDIAKINFEIKAYITVRTGG